MNPDLIAKVYTNVVYPLTEWQQNYLSRNDIDGAMTIQNMIETLNVFLSMVELHDNEVLRQKAISRQLAERYSNDMAVANARLKELQRIIEAEEYFTARTRYNK